MKKLKRFNWEDDRLEYKGWKAVITNDNFYEITSPEGERIIGSEVNQKEARKMIENFLFLRAK